MRRIMLGSAPAWACWPFMTVLRLAVSELGGEDLEPDEHSPDTGGLGGGAASAILPVPNPAVAGLTLQAPAASPMPPRGRAQPRTLLSRAAAIRTIGARPHSFIAPAQVVTPVVTVSLYSTSPCSVPAMGSSQSGK
jgi:hypothetical protein